MDLIVIILLCLSTLLFIISFFQTDKVKVLEKEVEQLSMDVLQEHFLINKKLKVLEEELLMDQDLFEAIPNQMSPEPNEILKNQVLALYNQGLDLHQISKQSSLPIKTITMIINSRQDTYGGL
ncbi:hypothetical protein [Lederbergia citrea]|uniref:hypothetical protein n=1 Tax=Lederbergia citrea TaxID=2833581 RepID=UPI001BC9BDF3|nr:hypothetical protein [Lederbergia citrea]MBS4176338.1 hypothetical protein [Lederbergia citrea]MBS4202899.1 hypothetical protein [Lederbergia citrea]